MSGIRFIKRARALSVHQRLIETFGGIHGVRDVGLLDSALGQPQATFDGALLHPDVPAMASAYFFHLIQNHPFVDGNKRTGASIALIFAEMNGFEPIISNAELHRLAVDVATSKLSKDDVIALFSRVLMPNKAH